MNMLAQFGGNQKTMSSREIAELSGKQHGHVCRDVEALNATYEKMGLSKIGEGYYTHPNTGSQQHREFLLTKEQCIDLVTGYNAELRIKINRRWAELEGKNRELSRMEILQMALESEQQKLVLQQQLEIQAPKVAFVDKYVAGNGNKTFRQVAKLLQIKEYKFREFLESNRIMYKLNGEWTAYQNHVDAKRFHVKTGVSDSGHAFNHALFTPKGIEWIAGELAKFNLRGVA